MTKSYLRSQVSIVERQKIEGECKKHQSFEVQLVEAYDTIWITFWIG